MKRKIKKIAHSATALRTPVAKGTKHTDPVLQFTKILVPVDFSECSRKAIEYAVQFARQFHAEIALLHVVHVNYYAANSEYTTFDYPELIEETRRTGERELGNLASSLPKTYPIKTLIRTGHPGSVIVDAAKKRGMDLIIISTHGHTGFKRVFLGSTAEYVLRYAPCPVLIVRQHEREFV